MTNTNGTTLSSAELYRLDNLRSQITMPIGFDEVEILNSIPGVTEIANSLENGMQVSDSLNDLLVKKLGAEKANNIQSTDAISIGDIQKGTNPYLNRNVTPNGRKDLRSHWRKLLNELPGTATIKSIGDYGLITHEIIEGDKKNKMHILVDFSEKESTKKKGLSINILQEQSEGKVWDINNLFGMESKVYLKQTGIMWLFINPLTYFARIASINGKDVYLNQLSLDPNNQRFVSHIVTHEKVHIKQDFAKVYDANPELKFVSLSIAFQDLATIMSTFAFMKNGNPFLLLASLTCALALYLRSRQKGSPLNKGYNALLALEGEAYFSSLVFDDILKNKGYINHKSGVTPEKLGAHLSFYQPTTWLLIQKIHELLTQVNRIPQPSPATGYSFN